MLLSMRRGATQSPTLDPHGGEARILLECQKKILARPASDDRHDPVDALDPFLVAWHQHILGPADGIVAADHRVTVTV